MQPIVVRPLGVATAYEIVAGERRWRAAQRADLHEVPVVIRTLSDQEALEIAIIENVQRADLNAIEEARAMARSSTVTATPKRTWPRSSARAAVTSPIRYACSSCRRACKTWCAMDSSAPATPAH